MIGAQASNDQLEKILSYIDIGKQEGAKVLIGGKRAKFEGNSTKAIYVQPTILEGHNKMRVFQEESSGRSFVTPFKDDAEALAIANDTLSRNRRRRVDARRHPRLPLRPSDQGRARVDELLPSVPRTRAFGGYKQSGIGRENHKLMLDHYQQTKNLLVSYSPKALGFF